MTMATEPRPLATSFNRKKPGVNWLYRSYGDKEKYIFSVLRFSVLKPESLHYLLLNREYCLGLRINIDVQPMDTG
jgi:hypothetical protein